MLTKTKTMRSLVAAGLMWAGAAWSADENPVDPAALKALDAMGAHLRGLTSFSVQANDTLDEVLENGQKIQLSAAVKLDVRKPDGLRAEIETDRRSRRIFYDGKNFTLYAPQDQFFVTVPAAPTLREMLNAVETKYGIAFPLVDLFHWGEDASLASNLKEAMLVGPSRINGQLTDHYAFRQEGLDWQIWIAQGEAPLPLRYVITTLDEPGEPQYSANLTWDTAAKFDAKSFTFVPGQDDHPIPIVAIDVVAPGQ